MGKYTLRDFISIKSATAGALIMGGMVYFVNREFGFDQAIVAALKQAFYTFFFGGACVRISEIIAVKTENKFMGIALGTLVASCITTGAVYTIHVMKGTPLPIESTIPTLVMAPPGFIFLAWIYRTKKDKEKLKEAELSKVLDQV